MSKTPVRKDVTLRAEELTHGNGQMDPFDGKVGLWSFTLERPAKRNNIRTGTVVGETIILEDVRVDAVEYRTKVVAKGGVFEKMREVMWWFHTAARYKTVAGVRAPCGKNCQWQVAIQ